MRRAAIWGLLIWLAGTVAIRFSGHALLRSDALGWTALLYSLSFLLMAWAMPRICAALRIQRERWFEAAMILMLPTLLLDPWACVFFSGVYPNFEPATAGLFGGWMLIFCAGGAAGVWWRQTTVTDR